MKLNPRTIEEVGGSNVKHNANLTSPGRMPTSSQIMCVYGFGLSDSGHFCLISGILQCQK